MMPAHRRIFRCFFTLLAFASLLQLHAADRPPAADQSPASALATTPPMGWNSWDGYGTTINEADFKTNADWLAKQCAVKGAGLQRVQLPPGNWFAPPGSNRGGSRGNEAVGALGVKGR